MMSSSPPPNNNPNFKNLSTTNSNLTITSSPLMNDNLSLHALEGVDFIDYLNNANSSSAMTGLASNTNNTASTTITTSNSSNINHHAQLQHHLQLQQLQQQQQQQLYQQQQQLFNQNDNSYSIIRNDHNEFLDFVPISNNFDPNLQYPPSNSNTNTTTNNQMTESYSNSTISSINSSNQFQTFPSSASASSIINLQQTPLRSSTSSSNLRPRSSSTVLASATLTTTPVQTPTKRSNSYITPRRSTTTGNTAAASSTSTSTNVGHRRSKSKMSLVDKSPINGNPFYTPPYFLSPKIGKHRKHKSITTSISLNHLDTDLQLQNHQLNHSSTHNFSGSPMNTPLRTPGRLKNNDYERDEDDEDEDDGEDEMNITATTVHNNDDDDDDINTSSFISPAMLLKEKFGGKLSELQPSNPSNYDVVSSNSEFAYNDPDHHQQRDQIETNNGSQSFINPEFLNTDISLMIDPNNTETLNSDIFVFPHVDQHQQHQPVIIRSNTMPPLPSQPTSKLTRSRSSINLSDIAAFKEAKTAALRSSTSFTYPIREESNEESVGNNHNVQFQQPQSAPPQLPPQFPTPSITTTQPSPNQSIMNRHHQQLQLQQHGLLHHSHPFQQTTHLHYLTPPTSSSSSSPGTNNPSSSSSSLLHNAATSKSLLRSKTKASTQLETIKSVSPENKDTNEDTNYSSNASSPSKSDTNLSTSTSTSSLTRSKKTSSISFKEPEMLDLPHQSSRSKSRSKNSDQEKKKIHECPLCHSKFQRPEHVKRHMRSHSSEKPFVCNEEGCGKRFNRNDNLKQHLRKIHGLIP